MPGSTGRSSTVQGIGALGGCRRQLFSGPRKHQLGADRRSPWMHLRRVRGAAVPTSGNHVFLAE